MRDEVPLSPPTLFQELFSPTALLAVFKETFSEATSKGVDRLNGFQYGKRAESDVAVVSAKCLSGRYRFSPYLENLKLKGRGKAPRLISIPTVRDRIVLHQLKKILAAAFPECVPRNIAGHYVRAIAEDLSGRDPAATFVCGCDIKTFYDDVRRTRLLERLDRHFGCPETVCLIKHALLTPTVSRNARQAEYKTFATENGVPQGLAISNILASIYLQEVDDAMKKMSVTYFRYVDDVIMYGPENDVVRARKSLGARLRARGLSLHSFGSGKRHLAPMSRQFGYLGYLFAWPKVTVRELTIERLLQTLAAKFSDYIYNKEQRLRRFDYLTKERLKTIFLAEINERISGAISGRRRYGWIAYFSQINDLTLLHRLDHTVAAMFRRLSDFDHKPPGELKTFRRAYFEIKFNPNGVYVHDYDAIDTPEAKLSFLVGRGRVGPKENLTDEEINARFERYMYHVLSAMEADEEAIYG